MKKQILFFVIGLIMRYVSTVIVQGKETDPLIESIRMVSKQLEEMSKPFHYLADKLERYHVTMIQRAIKSLKDNLHHLRGKSSPIIKPKQSYRERESFHEKLNHDYKKIMTDFSKPDQSRKAKYYRKDRKR